jgi:hemerythrin-like domain-containing protein
MSDQLIPNIGNSMMQIHDAITRSLQVTKTKCQAFSQPAGEPDLPTRESFMLYVSTMGMVINAHHLSEDQIIFPRLRVTLSHVPFDSLSADHRVIDVILTQLRQTVAMPASHLFADLLAQVTRLFDLWLPHIALEKRYIYLPEITDAFLSPAEQGKLLQDSAKFALAQGNPALIVPFLLYNLEPLPRAAFASFLPPDMVKMLVPVVWKPQWAPMLPFLL